MGAQLQARGVDGTIAALAGRQHGVVARRQLLALGLGRRVIGWRLDHGRLHPVHRGVYAVGHRVGSIEGRWMAAVLAVGDDAVLSHRSAAALWGIRPTSRSHVEVTAPRGVRSRAGLQVHQAEVAPDEVTAHDGIPVTTPPRTLLDLAAVVPVHHLERAMNEAERQHLTDPLSLDALLHRHAGDRGTRALRRALERAQPGGLTLTRSELEDRFLAFLDARTIPRPAMNVPLAVGGGTIEADCLWRRERLVVELDGYTAHATRAAFERDRARDRRLQAAGWRVVRIKWRQLHDEPREVAAELRSLLVTGHATPAAARPVPSG